VPGRRHRGGLNPHHPFPFGEGNYPFAGGARGLLFWTRIGFSGEGSRRPQAGAACGVRCADRRPRQGGQMVVFRQILREKVFLTEDNTAGKQYLCRKCETGLDNPQTVVYNTP